MRSRIDLSRALEARRRELGMTHDALARRSGVSVATVKRILAGTIGPASFEHVVQIAEALGQTVSLRQSVDAQVMERQQARAKAKALIDQVQGTSSLEAQGVDRRARQRMIDRTVRELLAGSPRKLWAA